MTLPPDFWSIRGAAETVATNLVAFFAFWIPAYLIFGFVHTVGLFHSGPVDLAAILVTTLLGAAMARRIRANITFGGLSVAAAAIAVNLVVDIVGASRSVGFFGSSAFGWIVAVALGVVVGFAVGRNGRRRETGVVRQSPESDELETVARTPTVVSPRQPFLRLGLQAHGFRSQ